MTTAFPLKRWIPPLCLALLGTPRLHAGGLPAPGAAPSSGRDLPLEDARRPADNADVLNPTGGPVRTAGMDAWGSGEYLAPRNDPDTRGRSLHYGIDYVGRVNQKVVAPISGKLRRTGRGANTGAVITGNIGGRRHKIKLLHFTVTVPDGPVVQGGTIGKVKDLNRYYRGMTPHVHMEVHEWRNYFGYRQKDPNIVVRPSAAPAEPRE